MIELKFTFFFIFCDANFVVKLTKSNGKKYFIYSRKVAETQRK